VVRLINPFRPPDFGGLLMLKGLFPPLVPALWSVIVLGVVLIIAAVFDLRSGRIPNWLTYPAIIIGLVGHGIIGGIHGKPDTMGLVGSAIGFTVGFFPLLLCWLAGGIGGGDVKLTGAIGALGGWRLVLGAMLYGFIIAAIMAVVVMIRRKIVRRTLKRVWNTMVLLVIPGSRPGNPTDADSPRIALASAICLGTIIAMLEPIIRSKLGW